ncbi:ferritin-like fold-containing protein [Micromonospora sp. M12]
MAGRLSMRARRLVGEALSQAGRVAAERATLTALIARDGRVATCRGCSGSSPPRGWPLPG